MLAIFKREFKSFFNGVIGWIFIAFLLLFVGIFVYVLNLLSGYASFENTISNIWFLNFFIVAIPLLTMRSFAEERNTKSDQLLYSLPLSVGQIVLGKYLAMLAVFAIPVLIIAFYPFVLSAFGYMAYKSAYLAILGFFALGAALIALGMFISSLTESQVIAAIVGYGSMFLMSMMYIFVNTIPSDAFISLILLIVAAIIVAAIAYLMTKNYYVALGVFGVLTLCLVVFYFISPSSFEGLFGNILSYLALFDRFTDLTGGIFDVSAIVYLISFAAFFVYLTVQAVEKRRWS